MADYMTVKMAVKRLLVEHQDLPERKMSYDDRVYIENSLRWRIADMVAYGDYVKNKDRKFHTLVARHIALTALKAHIKEKYGLLSREFMAVCLKRAANSGELISHLRLHVAWEAVCELSAMIEERRKQR